MQSVRTNGAAVPSSGSSDTSTRTHLVDDILEEDWERQRGVLQLVQTAVNQSFILKKKKKSQFKVTNEAKVFRTATVFSWYIFGSFGSWFSKSATRLQLTRSRTRENSGVLRVFSGSAGFLVSCSSVSGGTCLMKKYLPNAHKSWKRLGDTLKVRSVK